MLLLLLRITVSQILCHSAWYGFNHCCVNMLCGFIEDKVTN